MYKQKRKLAFMNTLAPKFAKTAERVFSITEPYEETHSTDLCQLSDAVLQEIQAEHSDVRSFASMIDRYIRWCEDTFQRDDRMEKIKVKMVASPKHLDWKMDMALDKAEMETTDSLMRAYFWLAFSGVPQNEIISMTKHDIDFENMVIFVNGRYYELYRESLRALRNVCFLPSFHYINPNYTGDKKNICRARKPGDNIFRGIRRAQYSLEEMISQINKKLKPKGVDMDYTSVFHSGIYYRMYEMERAGFEPDMSSYLADRMAKAEKKAMEEGRTFNRKTFLNQVKVKLKKEYTMWKKAYA